MKKLDETTKEPHFYSSKDIYFPCEKDAGRRLFRLQFGKHWNIINIWPKSKEGIMWD